MSEQSYSFDFARVPSFMENFNIAFFIDEMYKTVDGTLVNEGENAYELVWVSYGYDNIQDYLDEFGNLKDDVTIYDSVECTLEWIQDEFGDATVGLYDEVSFDIGDENVPLKALFLRDASTGYVMGYCINIYPFYVTNEAVFDGDIVFWDITRLNSYV